MLRDRKQLGAVAVGEQKISALTRTAATLSDLSNAPESHTEQIGRPMARVAEPVSAGLGRLNLSYIIKRPIAIGLFIIYNAKKCYGQNY